MEKSIALERTYTFPGATELLAKASATEDAALRDANYARLKDLQRLYDLRTQAHVPAEPDTSFNVAFNALQPLARAVMFAYYVQCRPISSIRAEYSLSDEEFQRIKNAAKAVLIAASGDRLFKKTCGRVESSSAAAAVA